MKTFGMFVSLLAVNFAFAQYDLEDQEEIMLFENNKTLLKMKIEEPFLQIAVRNCHDFEEW